MAAVASRQGLKDYCLRRLGYPVIDINVDDQQIEDRIDDALQKYRDNHYDATEHVYYKILVTANDLANKYFTLPESMIGIVRILNIDSSIGSSTIFNARYQMHLNDIYNGNLANIDISGYVSTMRHVETIEQLFSGVKPIRFQRHQNILNVDLDWNTLNVGDYIIADGYKAIDPEVYTDVYGDSWLKKYTTALIKRQWGSNLSKFEGMQLPGGVTFNGKVIYEEADAEIMKMEDEIVNSVSGILSDLTG
jgi:hypothetical protein